MLFGVSRWGYILLLFEGGRPQPPATPQPWPARVLGGLAGPGSGLGPGLAWLGLVGLAWLGLAGLGPAWVRARLGLAWLGLAWLGRVGR